MSVGGGGPLRAWSHKKDTDMQFMVVVGRETCLWVISVALSSSSMTRSSPSPPSRSHHLSPRPHNTQGRRHGRTSFADGSRETANKWHYKFEDVEALVAQMSTAPAASLNGLCLTSSSHPRHRSSASIRPSVVPAKLASSSGASPSLPTLIRSEPVLATPAPIINPVNWVRSPLPPRILPRLRNGPFHIVTYFTYVPTVTCMHLFFFFFFLVPSLRSHSWSHAFPFICVHTSIEGYEIQIKIHRWKNNKNEKIMWNSNGPIYYQHGRLKEILNEQYGTV